MKTEQQVLEILGKQHSSDLQSDVYSCGLRNAINASDVINSVKLLDLIGFKVVKK